MSESSAKPGWARRRSFLAGVGLAAPWMVGAARPTTPASTVTDARDFGAVGDGVRDDTKALQAALDAAAVRGGTVLIPPGVYSTRTLTIGSKVHLAGSGIEATILRLRDQTNDDLIRTRDVAKLTGGNSTGGPFNWSVRDLTLDGNRAHNSAGSGLRVYGWGYLLRDLRIRQCAGAGISSEWSTKDPLWSEGGMNTPGDSMEAQVVNLKVHDCGAGGIVFRGPHDTQFVNCIVWDTKTQGFHIAQGPKFSATGCQLVNCHVWGGAHEYGYKIEAGYVTLVNCVAEWATKAQVHVNYNDTTIVGGRYFGDSKARHVGIEIGAAGVDPIYGTSIDARMADLHGGAFKFTNEGGAGQIRALVYQRGGVPYTGKPSRETRFELQVNGIEGKSVNWIPVGSLGWNGGEPIVRHLSGTASWEPASVAPGAAASTEVPVERAMPGDTVAVGFSQPLPPGALLAGAVSGPGVVAVTLLNATGRTLQPGPGMLRADCWVH